MIAFAIDLARRAGERLLTHYGKLDGADIAYKGRVDLVTVADREAEALIADAVTSRFPDHAFLAEEQPARAGRSGARWIVDPLDGTTNFVHGFPFFCVSIALEVDGVLELGVVHAPKLGETFHAVRGEGAHLDGRRVSVSATDALIRSLLATGFAYDRWESERTNLDEFARLTMATRGVRRVGAAALDLAFVSAGRLDGFWEFGLAPWDVAAGALLVREAGGVVTGLSEGVDASTGEEIVATNGAIHEELVRALTPPGN